MIGLPGHKKYDSECLFYRSRRPGMQTGQLCFRLLGGGFAIFLLAHREPQNMLWIPVPLFSCADCFSDPDL